MTPDKLTRYLAHVKANPDSDYDVTLVKLVEAQAALLSARHSLWAGTINGAEAEFIARAQGWVEEAESALSTLIEELKI